MSTLNLTRSLCALAFMASLLSACGGGDDGVVGTGFSGGPGPGTVEVTGTAQKGPYLKGSEVLVSALSATGVPSPDTTLSEIQDDMGTFVFQVAQAGPVLIAADGYHFNEITGSLSQGRLLLRAVYNATVDAQQNAYVNVLTHLTYKRTLTLLAQGVPVVDAIRQAETEVLQALRTVFPISDVTDFTQLSIYNTDTSHAIGNAYVLALSATVYQAAMLRETQTPESSVDAQLTAILNTLSDDIADDASVADATILSELIAASHQVRPDQVRTNLEARSLAIVLETLPVADLDLFIDSDGDGVVNAQDGDDDNDGVVDTLDDSPYVYSEAPVLVPTEVTTGIASNTPFTLQWTTSEFAARTEIQLAKDESFNDILDSSLTTESSFSGSLVQGVYYLRARAQSTLGGWGPWSVATELAVDTFAKAYLNPGVIDHASSVIQTRDGGFLVVGSTQRIGSDRFLGSSTDGLVEKFDEMGRSIWRSIVASADEDHLWRPFETIDGDFLMVHSHYSFDTGRSATNIAKLDATGSVLWDLELKNSLLIDHDPHFVSEEDGVVVGMSLSETDLLVDGNIKLTNPTAQLLKLGKNGEILWSYQFDNTQNQYTGVTGLWKASDGSYKITGNIDSPRPQYDYRFPVRTFFATLSPDRATLGLASIPADLFIDGVLGLPKPDGGFVLAGRGGRDAGLFGPIPALYSFSATGELLFSGYKTEGCGCYFGDDYMVANADVLIFGGLAHYGDDPNKSAEIVEASAVDGHLIARHQYSPSTLDYRGLPASFASTNDGGLVLVGEVVDASNSGSVGFLLIKTDSQKIAPKTLTVHSTPTPN